MSGETKRLLVVGWEVADWDVLHPLMDAGELPALRRLQESGASGTLACPPPQFSAARWTGIATGKRAWQHQVCLPTERSAPRPVPVGAKSRGAHTIWEILSELECRSMVVGWPASHGGELHGISVSDRFPLPTAPPGQPWPGAAVGSYHPQDASARLDALRVRPEQITPEMIASFVPDWRQVDQARDSSLAKLRLLLAADASFQQAITELISSEPWDFAAVRFPAIGMISRMFSRHHLHADTPSAKPMAIFREVLPASYRMLDAMLGRLVDLAGPDTAVVLVSAGGIPAGLQHGNSETNTPGMFVAAGPGFERDTLIHGANALDITPTLLSWFGVPHNGDMEGRILDTCFSVPPEIRYPAGPEQNRTGPWADLQARLSPDERRAFEWNQVQSLIDAGRFGDALPRLEELVRGFPEYPAFVENLFKTQLALGRLDDAQEWMEVVRDSLPPFASHLCQAELAWACGETGKARESVRRLLEFPVRSSAAWHRAGMLLVALREWETLEKCARAVLEQGNDEVAWLGLAEALLRRRDFVAAAKAAQRATGIRYSFPEAHLALARAIAAQGMTRMAIEALDRLLQIQPANELARAYQRRLSRTDGAEASKA